MKAWHWVKSEGGLWVTGHGGLVVEPGRTLRHDGPIVMARSGLHACPRIIDALRYARGSIVCRVEMVDVVVERNGKLVGRDRTILWGFNAEDALWDWARRCALSVLHLWDAPDVVTKYLRTGDETLRDAAGDAARDADWAAARAAARGAARGAAWDAAMNAARAAAWDAAGAAAGAAARAAAGAAAGAAARAAARDAAWDAAWAAARAAQDRWLRTRILAEARRRGLIGGKA